MSYTSPATASTGPTTRSPAASNAAKLAEYPSILEPIHAQLPKSVRQLWEQARAHSHPYHWAAFTYLGT